MSTVSYLAEYLARIKSIAISLQLPKRYEAQKLTFKDLRTASIHICNVETGERYLEDIVLPEDVSVTVSMSEYNICDNANMISFRIPAVPNEAKDYGQTELGPFLRSKKLVVPWSASELSQEQKQLKSISSYFRFQCSNCESEIISSINVNEWHQLPSEHWAEMMDFWHCHKPATSKDNGHDHKEQYGQTRFVPRKGMAFVGISYFLSSVADAESGVEAGPESTVLCKRCHTDLGNLEDENVVKLWKWNLTLSNSNLYVLPKFASSFGGKFTN